MSLPVVTGAIPSEFCDSAGISIYVEGTAIHCYSGCLTSSHVLIVGASAECHDGRIMQQFAVILSVVFAFVLVFSVAFRLNLKLSVTSSPPDAVWCTDLESSTRPDSLPPVVEECSHQSSNAKRYKCCSQILLFVAHNLVHYDRICLGISLDSTTHTPACTTF